MKPRLCTGVSGGALGTGGSGMSQETGFQPLLCHFCSEEKAKLLREIMAKIEDKNEVLE